MNRIGILVVDDHPLFRRGIRMGLEGERDFLIVAEAADGPAAIQAADQFAPDVVLLDISLPTMSGFDVARAIKRRHPRTRDRDPDHARGRRPPLRGDPLRRRRLRREVDRDRRAGRASFGTSRPGTARRRRRRSSPRGLLDEVRSGVPARRAGRDDYSPLSPREIEILGFVSQGLSNKEIASILRISDQTVKNNITSILRKLQVNDRTQAVIYALRHGWIDLGAEEAG